MSLGTFMSGAAVGGSLVFGSLSYHFLRTEEGLQMVPKLSATFHETYIDVRNFGAGDWALHKTIVAAIVRAKKDAIFEGTAVNTSHEGVTSLLKEYGDDNPGS
jgi:hypothetical protein